MRGGLERWKRGVESQGVRQAISYALKGTCDSHLRATSGAEALAAYGSSGTEGIRRFIVEDGAISTDLISDDHLRLWVDGRDPGTGEQRGRDLSSAKADLLLDGTINAPKSFSIAALIDPELAAQFEALQDRLRDRIITTWQLELNGRRGAAGRVREDLHRVEVVELQHRRSRALDPHIHRHLWLNVKVQGRDGQWSNVDSRVAMKLHTVINAEGDLAARTDPEWIAALSRHGYTLNEDGEIAELAHVVRPLSRRSTQIEANRAMLLTRWRDEHPGEQPSPDIIHQIDRWAWAKDRPNKPGALNEDTWAYLMRQELAALDQNILRPPSPIVANGCNPLSLDRRKLAAQAIVDADDRSTGRGGRFSLMDIRAGAIRALAGCGLIGHRASFTPLIDAVTKLALELTIDLLDGEVARPDHVKGYMSIATATLKTDLAGQLDALSRRGEPRSIQEIAAAENSLDLRMALGADQVEAASTIAGTDRLVSVTGPAGAGKTTMLRVAKVALNAQGRRMVVVAPTKKAASVAAREIGTSASSLHSLLADHGWRWTRDPAQGETWTRLAPGDVDPNHGSTYEGPRRYLLAPRDRIVVDEAGMVDLHTANALMQIATDTGAGIAMVGDPLQAMPVGHRGAMAALTRSATGLVELTSVHRFSDPDYAALTLRLRDPATLDAALEVATELQARGQVVIVPDAASARAAMVDAYFRYSARRQRVALVTGANDDADEINEAIQQRRVDCAELSTSRIAVGADEQRLLEGDVVQTRRNDTAADVENRAVWIVSHIRADHIELVSAADSTLRRSVDVEYTASHVHLAYASTVHGIQGETTDFSIVGPGVDASGLYVGMTRGRNSNEAIVVAPNSRAGIDELADTMMRGRAETTIGEAIHAARTELNRAARAVPDASKTADPRAAREQELASVARIQELRQLAADLREWIEKTARALLSLDAVAATGIAKAHCRTGKPMASPATARAKVIELVSRREAELDELTREIAIHAEPGTPTARGVPFDLSTERTISGARTRTGSIGRQ